MTAYDRWKTDVPPEYDINQNESQDYSECVACRCYNDNKSEEIELCTDCIMAESRVLIETDALRNGATDLYLCYEQAELIFQHGDTPYPLWAKYYIDDVFYFVELKVNWEEE
jgi:hypothetical protein